MQLTLRQIRKGPSHLEQFLSTLVDSSKSKRDELYKEWIQKVESDRRGGRFNAGKAKYFCLAYLWQQSATYSADKEEKKLFLEMALSFYERFLKKRFDKGEENYYACYSIGIIMQSLGYPWKKAEEMFLLAFEMFPGRGEPIQSIINYYQSRQEWSIAYIFTTYAKDHFLDNQPLNEKWGVDNDLYKWKVLDYHAASCFSLGRVEEAANAFLLLYRKTVEHPELFRPEQIKQISAQSQLFPQIEMLCPK